VITATTHVLTSEELADREGSRAMLRLNAAPTHRGVKSNSQNSQNRNVRSYLSCPWRIVDTRQPTRKPDREHFPLGTAGGSSVPAAAQ